MSGALAILLPLTAGVALGAFHFGGLWGTLGRLSATRSPALLTLASFCGRLALTSAGFWFIAVTGRRFAVLVSLAGFLAARSLLVARLGPRGRSGVQTGRGAWS